MLTKPPAFLETLTAEASQAEIAELEFRKSVASEIATRERRRQFAYRRLDLAGTMLSAVRSAETVEAAQAAGTSALKRELGWNTETEARKAVLAAWSPVVAAIWNSLQEAPTPQSSPAPVAAMAQFETWYAAKHGQPFLATFDVELPELPVVEF